MGEAGPVPAWRPGGAGGEPARVCVVLLTGLGDVIHGLPVVNALKREEPGCHITWVAEPMPAGILRPHPAVDDVVVFEKAKGARGVRGLREAMRGRRFDVALNLNIYFKSVFPLVFSRAPRRIGFDRGRSRDLTWLFCTETLVPGPRRHTQDMFLEFLEVLGVRDRTVEWRIPITPEERRAQEEFVARLDGRPFVAVVPASAKAAKDWLAERYAEVVDALASDFGLTSVLLGGPGERENRIARRIVELSSAKPVLAMGDGVRRLAWVIDAARLVIAPDTGPVHIARALEVPVIGLYGHTNPWRVGPWRKFEDLWVDRYTDPGEPPDPSRFDPKSGRMEQITVADVLERVERAVERYGVLGTAVRGGRPAAEGNTDPA